MHFVDCAEVVNLHLCICGIRGSSSSKPNSYTNAVRANLLGWWCQCWFKTLDLR
jgi:hypothetical protein